jgi:hypothetical protein
VKAHPDALTPQEAETLDLFRFHTSYSGMQVFCPCGGVGCGYCSEPETRLPLWRRLLKRGKR